MTQWQELSIDALKAPTKNAIAMGPFGSRIKAENFVTSGIPVIKGANLNGDFLLEDEFDYLTLEKADELIASNAYPGDIVITHRGTVGQVGIIPRDANYDRYVVSQSQLKVTLDNKKVNPFFVYYFLRSRIGQHRLLMNASQVGVPAIAQASTSVKKILVPVPSREAQDQIVDTLISLDKKIELNRKQNQTLEAIAQTLFKRWFVEFEFPDENGNPYKSSGGAMQPSELGEIPVGWNVQSVSSIAEINANTLSKKDQLDEIHYIEISEVMRGDINQLSIYERGEEPSRARRRLRHGDTALSTVRPDRGAYFLALDPPEELIASTGFAVLTPKDDFWSVLHAFATQSSTIAELGHLAAGGAYPAVRPEIIGDLSFAMPREPSIPRLYHEICAPLYEKAEHNRTENLTLSGIRDTLLPKLMSGELRVA